MNRRYVFRLVILLASAACASLALPHPLLARGGGGCLKQGTPVLTPFGEVAVDQLSPGDMVLAVNGGSTRTAEVQAVTQVDPQEYVELTGKGLALRVTATHPIGTAAGVFRTAGLIRAGDMILVRDAKGVRSMIVDSVARRPADVPAFNLLVAPCGTYVAGGVVVHNKGCFLPDTPIRKAGGTEVPISEIQPGDELLAFTPEGKVVTAAVQKILTHEVDEYCVVQTESIVLHVTPEHPFYVGNGTFKTLEALQVGDDIFIFDGQGLGSQPILGIELVRARTAVYNLQTDSPNTYFANGAAVHNKGGGCLEKGTPVLTPSGEMAVDQLNPGDMVLTVSGGSICTAAVRAVTQIDPQEYVELTGNGLSLRVTETHPIGTAAGVFRTAGLIRAGDTILIQDAGAVRSVTVDSVARLPADVPAFNLLVAPCGTYFAGGAVVHNKGCFLPDTPIRKADGTEVPISEIQPGDELLAFTPEGKVVTAAVQRVLTHAVDEYCVVQTESIVLHVTPEHPFYVGNGTFKTLEALQVGDDIFIFDGQGLGSQPILGIELVRARTTVYNLQTDSPNTYFANGAAVHNKGGGSHGGSHSSGGSGGDGDPRVAIVCLGLFVLAFIIAKIVEVTKRRNENLDFVYSPSKVAGKADKTLKLLQFLARQDPSMAPDILREQAKATFLKLQECWQAREYGPMQALMMPDLYADHCRQIAGMVRNHEINMIDRLTADRIDLINVRYPFKEAQREFTALITATALDYYLDDRTKERLRGDDAPAQFQEFWTFQRQGKAWLLREIEQSRESDILKEDNFFEQFTDTGLDQVYGDTAGKDGAAGPWLEKDVALKETRIERLLNFLVQTDKIWDRQTMLETARVIFVKLMGSWEIGDIDTIPSADLFPELAADLRKQIEANRATGLTLEFRNLCVRKVELILVRNFNDRRQDEYVARVRAHAQRVVRRQDTVLQQDDFVTPFEQFLTLGRLDERWKLKEILLPADAQDLIAQDNLDQESSSQQLHWYYQHKRAN